MDPNACFRLMLDRLMEFKCDLHGAAQCAAELVAWMDKGGFPPTITPADMRSLFACIVHLSERSEER